MLLVFINMKIYKYINKIIKEILSEVTVDKDFHYYSIAEDFYDKMIKELELL